MKLPSRPLVISSPIPISLLPTALLQDRMQTLLNAFLSLPKFKNDESNSSPFSLVMGPSRVIEAFLLHYDYHPNLITTANKDYSSSSTKYGSSQGTAVGGGAGKLSNDGMFEQSILQIDQSPYPLQLSHPKYTAAMKAAAAASSLASASASTSGPGSAPNELPSSLESSNLMVKDQRARSGSVGASSSSNTGYTKQSQQQQNDTSGVYGSGDSGLALQQSSVNSNGGSGHIMKPYQNSSMPSQHHQVFLHSAAAGRTVKPLLHTRAKDIPPAVSLSEGFAVRLAEEKDDLRVSSDVFVSF